MINVIVIFSPFVIIIYNISLPSNRKHIKFIPAYQIIDTCLQNFLLTNHFIRSQPYLFCNGQDLILKL